MINFLIMSDGHAEQVLDIERLFHQHGVRVTAQRRGVWGFFAAHARGCGMAEAVDGLKGQGIGQATVYRTVFLLADLGLLRRVQGAEGAFYIAIHPGHHHPLICQGCRRVVEFDSCDLSVLERLLGAETGYRIRGHHLEVFGLCPECQGGGG